MKLLLSIALLLVVGALAAAAEPAARLWVYIGTYTQKTSKGIYRSELDLATGKLTPPVLAGETASPSFLAIHPNHKFLYAVNETGNFQGQKSGSVAAFAIDPKTGDLKSLNQQPTGGEAPCHLVVDKSGKYVLSANYTGGSVSVHPIGADGSLGTATSFIQHESTTPKQKPHAHSINLDAANRFALVADLGLDKVLVYRFDPAKGTLTANDPPFTAVAPQSGPRHFAFHPDGRHAYVINERAMTVTAFDYDPERGTLKTLQTISTLPQGQGPGGGNSTAEVQVHPSGKFVYGSNRGHNSIVAYTVDPKSGELKYVANQGEGIKTPRNFGIDPTGTFLLVANQSGDTINVFRIDPQTGALKATGQVVEAPVPVCVKFMAPPR